MLVANGYALQAIDLLNFFDEILLDGGRSENFENFMRILGSLGYQLAFLNEISRLNENVLAVRNQVFFHLTGFFVGDKQSLFGAKGSGFGYDPVDFGHLSDIAFLGSASLEKLCYSWQTASDVLGL